MKLKTHLIIVDLLFCAVILVGLSMTFLLLTGCDKTEIKRVVEQPQYVDTRNCLAQCAELQYRNNYDYLLSPAQNWQNAKVYCGQKQQGARCCRSGVNAYRVCY